MIEHVIIPQAANTEFVQKRCLAQRLENALQGDIVYVLATVFEYEVETYELVACASNQRLEVFIRQAGCNLELIAEVQIAPQNFALSDFAPGAIDAGSSAE
jgi:hypothetical protein